MVRFWTKKVQTAKPSKNLNEKACFYRRNCHNAGFFFFLVFRRVVVAATSRPCLCPCSATSSASSGAESAPEPLPALSLLLSLVFISLEAARIDFTFFFSFEGCARHGGVAG